MEDTQQIIHDTVKAGLLIDHIDKEIKNCDLDQNINVMRATLFGRITSIVHENGSSISIPYDKDIRYLVKINFLSQISCDGMQAMYLYLYTLAPHLIRRYKGYIADAFATDEDITISFLINHISGHGEHDLYLFLESKRMRGGKVNINMPAQESDRDIDDIDDI